MSRYNAAQTKQPNGQLHPMTYDNLFAHGKQNKNKLFSIYYRDYSLNEISKRF